VEKKYKKNNKRQQQKTQKTQKTTKTKLNKPIYHDTEPAGPTRRFEC